MIKVLNRDPLSAVRTRETLRVDDDWQSLHCFLHDFTQLDDFLKHCISQLPPELLCRSFFVRYWLGGPHIRFRFRGARQRPAVQSVIHDYLQATRIDSTLDPSNYYRAYSGLLAAEIGGGIPPPWYGHGTVVEVAYQAEVERYGGKAAIARVEDYFATDSLAMLQAISQYPLVRRELLLFGCCLVHQQVLHELRPCLPLMATAPASAKGSDRTDRLTSEDQPAVAAQMRSIEAMRQQWRDGQLFPDWLTPYAVRLSELGNTLDQLGVADIASVFHSLLHMSFNRAGIRPSREATIRHTATRTWY